MAQANLKARFCRACDLKRGMQILSYQARRPRFTRIKSVTQADGMVVVKLGKGQVSYRTDQEVHVLEQ
jgi:hypothetical protein